MRIYKTLLVLFVVLLSCTSNLESQSDPMVGIFTMPQTPNVDFFANIDFYSDNPKTITKMNSDRNGQMYLDYTEQIDYQIGSDSKVITIRKSDADGSMSKEYLVEYKYENDHLVEMIVSRADVDQIINRKVMRYYSNSVEIDVYLLGELDERYTYTYGSSGLLDRYKKETIRASTGLWKTSFERHYFYDSQNRLVRLTSNLEEGSGTIYSYPDDNTVVIGTGSDPSTLVYDRTGNLLSEIYVYPEGSERDEIITQYTYDSGRLTLITRVIYSNGEIERITTYQFTY